MASLTRIGNGWRLQLYWLDGSRKSVRLPRGIDKRSAQAIRVRVESLIAAKLACVPIPQDTAHWLGQVSSELYGRLAAVGLVPPRRSITLAEFLEDWLHERRGDKPASLAVYRQVIANLLECFGGAAPLAGLTAEHGRKFPEYLRNHGYRPTTIGKRLACARTILNRAVELDLITSNPLATAKAPPANPAERRAYIPTATIEQALEYCPDVWWRLLLVLARFQGLRTPSEPLSLRWEHVLWDQSRLVIPVPKLEHFPGREYRVMPLFEQTRLLLAEAFEVAAEGAEYVFPESWRRRAYGKNGWKNCNLRTTFEKILLRAGIEPWPRLFHNLRASCESDLANRFPITTVASWIGNSVAIAARYYVSPLDSNYREAIENNPWKPGAKSGAVPVQNRAPQASEKIVTASQLLT